MKYNIYIYRDMRYPNRYSQLYYILDITIYIYMSMIPKPVDLEGGQPGLWRRHQLLRQGLAVATRAAAAGGLGPGTGGEKRGEKHRDRVLSMGKNGGTHMAIGEGGGLGKQNAGVLMGF